MEDCKFSWKIVLENRKNSMKRPGQNS